MSVFLYLNEFKFLTLEDFIYTTADKSLGGGNFSPLSNK